MKNSLIKLTVLSVAFISNCFAQLPGWEVVQSGINVNLNSIYFYDSQTGIACGDSGTVVKSIDSGKTWQSLPTPVTFDLNDCIMFSEDCFLSAGDSASGIVTYDGGITWLIAYHLLNFDQDIYSISFSRNDNGVYYGVFGADLQTIIIGSSVSCATVITDIWGELYEGGFRATQMLTNELGFVAGENSFSQPILGRTTNSGNDWEYISFYLDGNEGRATGVAFINQLIGFISTKVWDGRGAIAKTADNGNNWSTLFFADPLNGINFPLSGTNQVGYCVGNSGTVLKTNDAGETWQNQFSGTSENLKKVFFIDSNFGFAVGENGTILRTTTGGEPVVGIDIEVENLHKFELQQNYPNPFNPSTKISWQSPASSWQTLKVYDVLGNEIATLVDEYKSAGMHEITFDASSVKRRITSGVYFYRITVDNFTSVGKMLLLK